MCKIGSVDLGDLDLLPAFQPTESHEHMDKIHMQRLAVARDGDPDHQPAAARADPAASQLMHTAAQPGDRHDLAACDDSLEIGSVDLGALDLLPAFQPTESHGHMDTVAPGIGADVATATDASVEVDPLAFEYVEQLDDFSDLPRLAEAAKQTTDICCPYCDNVATIGSNVLKCTRKTNEMGKWWVGNAFYTTCLRLVWSML